ncbi:MAG: FAD-dependent oxidoreductase [Gammaproteobacteria bacterium]|nr:FAD-dependent oxidoreductase [Gammaproteobacteria bacterium]
MHRPRWLLLGLIIALLVVFFAFGGQHYLTLSYFREQREAIAAAQAAHPLAAAVLFFGLYAVITALSVPGALAMTLIGGALFGLIEGTALVSFASSIGATLAFIAARFLFRDAVHRRFGDRLRRFEAAFEREGAFYLFALRLVPVFPFFVVNLVMGLTPIRVRAFYWVSQLGMLPGTIVYVYAGTQLGALGIHGHLLSPGLIGAFVLLGVFPLLARRALEAIKTRRVYRGFRRPRRFDRNLIVIGAGSGGLVSAYIAAAVKARVTLIEQNLMGGDCLNTGCVPSKALIRTARLLAEARRAPDFGLTRMTADFDFGQVMERVQRVIAQVAPHDSVERYTGLGVEVLIGRAQLVDPWTVEVKLNDGGIRRLSARDIVLATGAQPFVPPIPGLAEAGYLTSDTVWDLRRRPQRLVVLGGGSIGCELAQCFARLGSAVTLVEMLPRLMIREDPEFSERVERRFRAEGIDVQVGAKAVAVETQAGRKLLVCERGGQRQRIEFDQILVAVGRAARLDGTGLKELGVRTGKTIEVDDYSRTNFPNIWACGDVTGPYQFTHTAGHTAWYAAVNALFGSLLWLRGGRFAIDYSAVPWATFTDPEVARVGLNETEAKEKGIAYEVTIYDLAELDRAIADGDADGLVKVLTVPGKDRILGVTIAGPHAGDVIQEYVLAMRYRIGLNKILGTIHTYPTLAEANKYAAGAWKQAHKPEKLLQWVRRYHDWRRGR